MSGEGNRLDLGTPSATLVEVIRRRCEVHPDRTAYIFLPEGEDEGERWSWAELGRRVRAVGAALRNRVSPGDRVLLLCPQTLDYASAFLGCLDAGAVAVPAYPPGRKRRDERLPTLIRDAAPRLILTTAAIADRIEQALEGAEPLPLIAVDQLSAQDEPWFSPPPSPQDLAFLQYTSGSTSVPKGVMVSHANLLANEEAIRLAFGHDDDTVVAGWLPFFHDMGLIGNLLQPLYVGAPCVLMPPAAFVQKPLRWLRMISRYGATTSGGPNFAYDLCLRKIPSADRQGLDLSSWEVAFNGAEPVRAETLRLFAEAFAPAGFRGSSWLPCYGLAEATLMVSAFRSGARRDAVRTVREDRLERGTFEAVEPGGDGRREIVCCGPPAIKHGIRIVAPDTGKVLPDGGIGEICVSGPSVACGYWERADETNRVFRARLEGDSEKTYLRTGDLGCLVEGELFVTGRIKEVLIVQGRNLYPQDIERAAAAADRRLSPERCAAFSWQSGPADAESFAVAAEVAGPPDDSANLLSSIRAAVIGECGVEPARIVLVPLGSIPKTSSGKTRRRECGVRLRNGRIETLASLQDTDSTGSSQPESRIADVGSLAAIIRRRLRLEDGAALPDGPLVSLGLTSIQAMELAFELESNLGLCVSPEDLLGGSLTDLLQRPAQAPTVRAVPQGSTRPLHPNELSLYAEDQRRPGTSAYHLAARVSARGPQAAVRLEKAIRELAGRIPALQAGLRIVDGQPRFECLSDEPGGLPIEESAPGDAGLAARLAERPFSMDGGHLWRARMERPADELGAATIVFHHLIADLWSLGLFARELTAILRGEPGRDLSAAPPTASAQRAAQSRPYWERKLGRLPSAIDLPVERRPCNGQPPRAGRLVRRFRLPAERLRARAAAYGVTPAALHLAALEALVARWTGLSEFAIGTPTSGRRTAAARDAFGYLVNPVVLAADLTGQPTFRELARRAMRELRESAARADLPFAELAEIAGTRGENTRDPLCNVMFVHQEAVEAAGPVQALALGLPSRTIVCGDLELEIEPIEPVASQRDLTWTTGEFDGEVVVMADYDAALLDADTVRRLLSWYERLLGVLLDAPETLVWSAPMLEPAQLALALAGSSAESRPVQGLLHERFEDHARLTPDAPAATFGSETWTYARLNGKADALANRLRASGAGPECLVAIALDRGLDQLAAMLGVLKSGAAYVPLDMTQPRHRLAMILEDAAPTATITTSNYGDLAGRGLAILLDGDAAEASGQEAPPPKVLSANLAYVIFTSGSSGRPKGCAITHANLLRLFGALEPEEKFGPEDVWSILHSTAFDFSVWEIWGAWLYGGRAVLIDEETRRDQARFAALLQAEGVTRLSQTPSAFRALLEATGSDLESRCERLRSLYFGGEAFDFALLERWADGNPLGRARLVNLYGITETTVHVTHRPLSGGDRGRTRSRIGGPLSDLRLYALDRRLQPAPVGVAAELYVAGPGLSRGYLGRPGLTAERFVPDPFSATPGERMYRTGDLVRLTPDGDREYLGRSDDQVQIRGYRVEPMEVQTALESLPEVEQAVVRARPLPRGSRYRAETDEGEDVRILPYRRYLKATLEEETGEVEIRLIAWVRLRLEDAGAAGRLRERVRALLPAPMVPAIVPVDRFAMTPNGKVDLAALPDPEAARPDLEAPYAPPQTPAERTLAELWSGALGVSGPGLDDNFFSLGGDSIRALQLTARAAERGFALTVTDLYRNPTIRQLARGLASVPAPDGLDTPRTLAAFELVSAEDRRRLPPEVTDAYPPARMQLGLLYHESLQEGEPIYRASFLYRFEGECRPELFEEALRRVIAQTPILRTSFDLAGFSEPLQMVWERVPTPLDVLDWSASSEAQRRDEWQAWFDRERLRAFDPSRPPLARFTLFRLGRQAFALGLTCHDAILDGWSTALLLTDLLGTYAALLGGRSPEVQGGRGGFAEFITLERAALRSEASRRWWRERVLDAPPLAIRWNPPTQAAKGFVLRVADVRVSAELSDKLQALSKKLGVSLKHVALAAHLQVLAALRGAGEVVTGLEVNGRAERVGGDLSVGQHLNTVPFRHCLGGGSWRDLIESVAEAERELWPHRRFPYAEIQKIAGGRPLYDTTFNYTRFHIFEGLARLPEIRLLSGQGRELTHYELKTECNVDAFTGRLHLDLIFDAARVGEEQARNIAACYLEALRAIARDPLARRSAASLVGVEERQRQLVEWNTTEEPFPETTLVELFERACRLDPDQTVLVFEGRRASYGQLRKRAGAVTAMLRARGVGPGSVVGVHLHRGELLPAALLGAMGAGAAYLPLDPSYPEERLRYMLQDAAAELTLTEASLSGRLQETPEIVLDALALDDAPSVEPAAALDPDSPAYVLFTSGSTGRPKGAVTTHRAICNRLLWMQRQYHLAAGERVLHKTPISFDVSGWELFWPLTTGATMVLARPGGQGDAVYLAELIQTERVTTLHFVPSMLRAFLEEPSAAECRSLKRTICSGEELTPDLVSRFFQALPGELHNLYGPTEAAIDVTAHACRREDADLPSVPIGGPISNTRVYVLDANLEPIPTGAMGTLFLGGCQLALGYSGRPGLTAERFVPSPFAVEPGERLYDTGDLARFLPDGEIELCGRADGQVKIRGARVEFGEIEAAIRELCDAVAAAATLEAGPGGRQRLVAYVQPRRGATVSAAGLRRALASRLPAAMIPDAVREVHEMPLTPSGKLDRKALSRQVGPAADDEELRRLLDEVEGLSAESAREILTASAGRPSEGMEGQ